MTKLKKCMCGGEAKIVKEFVPGEFYVYCLVCGIHGDIYKTEAEAITAWNTRPIEAELAGALEEIVRRGEKMCEDCEKVDTCEFGSAGECFIEIAEQALEKYKSK